MAKIGLQFHAVEDEIIETIKNSVFEYDLFLISIQLFPAFSCEIIDKDKFNEKINIIKISRMIFLYNYRPNISSNFNEFLDKNKDGLIFDIGQQNNNTLKESCISTITENIETLKIWKRIIKKFRVSLLKGAWVINPMNGAKKYYKNHYYTLSAKKEFEKGVKVLPYAGWCIYILNETI